MKSDDGSLIEADFDKATAFSAQYDSVYTVEDSPCPDLHASAPEMTEIDVTPDLVKGYLERIKVQSAPGPDGLHPVLLKTLSSVIHVPLATLFRRSLDCGKLPRDWKRGVIKPMFKGGRSCSPANYRPVTLTSVVGKIMERVIKEQLEIFLLRSGQEGSKQHGFTTKRSCISNLLTAREHWSWHLDSGSPVDVIFIDFSKAFDRVAHRRLIGKLTAMGIGGMVIDWIQDFLRDRTNQVEVNGVKALPTTPISGVPQGSVLGPFLFKAFVNDLPSELSTDCLLFADDLKIWAKLSAPEDHGLLQHGLNKLMEWTTRWMMPINSEKCACLHMGPGNPRAPYFLDGKPVKVVEAEKDLGMLVASSLKSRPETDRKAGAANRMLWAIRRAFSTVTPEIFRIVYASHIRPILEYGLPVSFPLTKGEENVLERVQRRATKIVKGFRELPYESRMHQLHLYPLEYRRMRYDLLCTRRIIRGNYGTELQQFFQLAEDSRTRGHSLKLRKRRTLRLPAKFTLSTRVVNSWNSLPTEAVCLESEEAFKCYLDKEILKWNDNATPPLSGQPSL